MGRSKNKQPGGHNPLTHHERTRKFASSEYGTVARRLAGHSQYQVGDCALSATPLLDADGDGGDEPTALCSPSGYLYRESAVLEYLLQRTRELKRQRAEFEGEQQRRAQAAAAEEEEDSRKRRVADFAAAQRPAGGGPDKAKAATTSEKKDATASSKEELKRVSYWLADSQPAAVNSNTNAAGEEPPPERPGSPVTGAPLRRKDLWPVRLRRDDSDSDNDDDSNKNKRKRKQQLVCAVSQKPLSAGAACVAYWTAAGNKKKGGAAPSAVAGEIVLQSVYRDLQMERSRRCPLTDAKIQRTRTLQQSGSSFAASGQNVSVKKYRPTIT